MAKSAGGMRRALVRSLAAVALTGFVAVFGATAVLPRLAGAQTFSVLTGSMSPHLPPGSLVVVRPVDEKAIGVGSVITYQLRSGDPGVVTHRVVAVAVTPDGPVFRTQGDANDLPDPAWVRPVQVRGAVWYAVPLLGHVNSAMSPATYRLVRIGAVAALALYAAVMLVSAGRDARRRARERSPVAVLHGARHG